MLVVGEMEDARAYTDRDGNMRASLEVRANSVRFLGQRGDNMGGDSGGGFGNSGGASYGSSSSGQDIQDEDIPF